MKAEVLLGASRFGSRPIFFIPLYYTQREPRVVGGIDFDVCADDFLFRLPPRFSICVPLRDCRGEGRNEVFHQKLPLNATNAVSIRAACVSRTRYISFQRQTSTYFSVYHEER